MNVNNKLKGLKMKTNMPNVDIMTAENKLYQLTETEEQAVKLHKILHIVVKKDGTVRASKPKVKDTLTGRASYVWRMVCFYVSPKGSHQCMPVCANFDLQDEDWKNRREVEKELDKVVDIIVNAVDKTNWHGVHRWGKALGY
jgi:hypothetical protein